MPEVAVSESLFGIGAATAPAAVVVGVPLDVTMGCREGGGNGPAAVRRASHALESYSPALERDLVDVEFEDDGDLELPDDVSEAVNVVDRCVDAIAGAGRLPVLIGGEHTVSTGAVRALRRRHPALVLLHVDAHSDLRGSYEGRLLTRASWIVHSGIPLDRVVQLGVRSIGGDIRNRALHTSTSLELPRALLVRRPVYVSIDIDVLDPSVAPGVRCPEPGGVSFRELEALVHELRGLDIVGADVVEVAPETDPAALTALAAAKLLRELLLLVA